jgi:hypothetical protein
VGSAHPTRSEAVWKVILVLDKPGQTIADVTKDTIAFAVRIPNTLTLDSDSTSSTYGKYIINDPDRNWYDASVMNGKEIGLISIDRLEEITGYDFLSNLPSDVQSAIEGRQPRDTKSLLKNIGLVPISAPITSENLTSLSTSPILGSMYDASVRHHGFPDQIASSTNHVRSSFSIFEVGTSQSRIFKTTELCLTENGTTSIDVIQCSSCEIGFIQASPVQISRIQTSISNYGIIQYGMSQDSSSQISSNQFSSVQHGSSEINASQIESFKLQERSVFLEQSDTSKIPFSIIASGDKFFSSHFPEFNNTLISHNSTSSYLTKLQSILLDYWNLPSDISLAFGITNLPVGQLAEATITGYDSFGRPNTATISIDNDANGVGWFIDTTPQEHSEFLGEEGKTYFTAAPNNAAYGKYDLLTTILHETGHVLGIINGYSEFEKNVKAGKFVTNTFTAQLTPDGSHLDSTLYPYDLLNTSLKPGIRKLPSQLDLAIINQLYSHPASQKPTPQNPNAALTAGALYAIENGDFTTTGWNLQGGTTISNILNFVMMVLDCLQIHLTLQ